MLYLDVRLGIIFSAIFGTCGVYLLPRPPRGQLPSADPSAGHRRRPIDYNNSQLMEEGITAGSSAGDRYLETDGDGGVLPGRSRRVGPGAGRGGVEHAQQRLVLVRHQRVAHERHRLPAPRAQQLPPVEPTKRSSGRILSSNATRAATDGPS